MDLDNTPLPWDANIVSLLTEIVAFQGDVNFNNFATLTIRTAVGQVLTPTAIQDVLYLRCLSHTFAFRNRNLAAIYQCDSQTGYFFGSRLAATLGESPPPPRFRAVAYQYRERYDRISELWLMGPAQTWYWVTQSVPQRLEMVVAALNDLARYAVTFFPGANGEAQAIAVEWVNP